MKIVSIQLEETFTPEEEELRQRIERFSHFFSKVNSAFSFRKVTVKVENSNKKAPAWSSANEVVFNATRIGELKDSRTIASLKGLDLHELSHILYTPRNGSDLVDWVIEKGYWSAFNALEDQRIESLFTAKYPSTVDWFTATILIHFFDNPEHFATSYPLLRGRRYLPVELRAQSRNAYPEQHNLDEISDIVDEYRLLTFPSDSEVAKDLIKRFFDLMPKGEGGDGGDGGNGGNGGTITLTPTDSIDNADVVIKINDPFGHSDRPSEGIESSPASRPVNQKKQKQDSQRIDKGNDDKELAEKLKSKPVLEVNADQVEWADDEPSNSDSDSDLLDESLFDSKSDSNKDSNDKDGEPSPTQSAGSEAGELISTILEEILSKESVEAEINDIVRQINGLPTLNSNNSHEPIKSKYQEVPADSATAAAARAFGRELERLKTEFDPYWDKYQDSGRINAIRFVRGDDFDSIYDKFEEGIDDATEIECVIILDNSGSMSGTKASNAYKAMYAIKKALDSIGTNTTVITFNSSSNTLYRANERATSVIRDGGAGGGTNAAEAVAYATKLLAETSKPVRIFFAITDGEWFDEPEVTDVLIERMARAGVLTAFAYIPSSEGERVIMNSDFTHKCEVGAVVVNPFDLVGMARKIVKLAITRRLVRH